MGSKSDPSGLITDRSHSFQTPEDPNQAGRDPSNRTKPQRRGDTGRPRMEVGRTRKQVLKKEGRGNCQTEVEVREL